MVFMNESEVVTRPEIADGILHSPEIAEGILHFHFHFVIEEDFSLQSCAPYRSSKELN